MKDAPQKVSVEDPRTMGPHLGRLFLPLSIERVFGILAVSAPIGLAFSLLWQTHFQVPVAMVIASARPLSSYVQEAILWLVVGVGVILSNLLATTGSRMLSAGRIAVAVLLWIAGAFLLIPYAAQLFNAEVFFAPVVPVLYIVYCAVGMRTGDSFAWVIPGAALASTIALVVFAPLPEMEVTWSSQKWTTFIVEEHDGETLVFDQASVSFSTYPTAELREIRPCFRTLQEGSIPWFKSTQPAPQCPSQALPVRG